MEPRSSISDDTTLKDACGHVCIRQRVAIPASDLDSSQRSSVHGIQHFRHTSGNSFSCHGPDSQELVRNSSSSLVPQDVVSQRRWPIPVVQLPRNPDSGRDVRWGHNIEAIPCISGVASARCSRLLCQFGYDVHQGIDVLSPRGRARIADPPGSRFFRPGGFINRANHSNSFFRLPEQDENQDRQLGKKLWFRSVSCQAERRCSAEVEN